MKQKNVQILLALMFLVFGAVVWFGGNNVELLFEEKSTFEDTENWNIDVKYPETNFEPLSKEIESYVRGKISLFKDAVRKNMIDMDGAGAGLKGSMVLDYSFASKRRIVSLVFHGYEYVGGAHGVSYFNTINFDAERRKFLLLEDVCLDDSACVEKISEAVRAKLEEKFKDEFGMSSDGLRDMMEFGAAPNIENFSLFTLLPDGITFYFPPYQVAPYAAGSQEVFIQYEEFEGLLSFEVEHGGITR